MLCRGEFRRNSGRKFLKFFRGRKNFRPKSREIAPQSLPIVDAQSCYDPQRSPSNYAERRHAAAREIISVRFSIENFEKILI